MAHETGFDNPYTRGIASFVSSLRFEDIPAEVRTRIKLLLLDTLGCGLYGSRLRWCQILRETLEAVDSSTPCAVWGTPHRLSAPHAALVNGTQVQGFEIDDVHRRGILHVGAVTLPALLAVAELRPGMSGRDFLTAAVAGYEIGPRVGMCMGVPEHMLQGWHPGATVGVFSAAAAAATALGLSEEKTVHALGIAGTQAAGLMAAQYGAMVKRMHAGRSSQSGLYAALLAEGGFTGIVNVLESEYGGFCTTFSRSRDRFDLSKLTAGLGERFETMGVSLKFYSCVLSNHTTLDALKTLRKERPFGPDDVERIVVRAHKLAVEHGGWRYRPEDLTAAQSNLSFCVATLLLEGEVFADQFSEKAITDPARLALAEKVVMNHDPEISALAARDRDLRHRVHVEVHLKEGTVLRKTVETFRGSDRNFASGAEIVEKFEKLARHILGDGPRARLRDSLLDLENLEDASELARLMSAA